MQFTIFIIENRINAIPQLFHHLLLYASYFSNCINTVYRYFGLIDCNNTKITVSEEFEEVNGLEENNRRPRE
jgi:hypothetical protein